MHMSKYDNHVVDDSEVFLSLSSPGCKSSIAEWKNLFNANKSSIYLVVLHKLLAHIKFVLIKFLIYLYS